MDQHGLSKWTERVVILSLLLLFFTIPHTLEDFATGAPEEAGIPASILSLVISLIFFAQALGLYWLGQGQIKGFYIHIALGLFWPIASGLAQLPAIFSGDPYRSGILSKIYVFGMIIIGILVLLASIRAVSFKRH
jgi:hypothetical protein